MGVSLQTIPLWVMVSEIFTFKGTVDTVDKLLLVTFENKPDWVNRVDYFALQMIISEILAFKVSVDNMLLVRT